DLAGADELGRRPRDPLLLTRLACRLVAQGQVGGGGARRRTAAGAGDELLLREVVEVPAGGRRGDAELGDDVVEVDVLALDDELEQPGQSFVPVHLRLLLPT